MTGDSANDVDARRVEELFAAVVELPPAERDRYLQDACADESTLRAEVASLLCADASAGDFLKPPVRDAEPVDARLGSLVGSWRLVREIGTGGMGRVYLAERADAAFEKQVAVKLLRTRGGDAELLRRFERERQVLASLEHANIARLIDGGATEDGTPYLVMEHVEGEPIGSYCDARRLGLTERIALFRSVCDAVQHAHRRLIVHRDLKPSNILVSDDGTVKLLDFGIAKVLESEADAARTATADRALTPRYASPEQIRGELVTTASDVYSLGVLLFELLSGGRPYDVTAHTPLQLERAMTEGTPTRPSAAVGRSVIAEREGGARALARRLAGDLDNIVLMAMRSEPERRYGSVERLSEDLRRHLQGFPVQARADTRRYRTAKFVARNAPLVIAGGLLALTLLAGAAISLHFALRAQEQRVLAEARFNDVRELAATFLTDVDAAVRSEGKTAARQTIVSTSLEYLSRLAEEPGDDPRVLRDVARGFFTVARIQGDPKTPSLGDATAALTSCAQGQRVARRLAEIDPGSVESRLVEIDGALLAGDLARHLGDTDAAIAHFETALAARERLDAAHQGSELQVPRLDTVRFRLGYALERFERYDEAIEHLTVANTIENQLIAAHPDEPELFEAQVTTLTSLSQAYRLRGQPEMALELLSPLRDRLIDEAQEHPDLRPTLANLRYNLGWNYVSEGDTVRGLEEIAATVAFYRGLAEVDPDDTTAHRNTAAALHDLGELQSLRGDLATGIAHYQEMVRLRRHVAERSPDSVLFRSELATALGVTADLLFRDGRQREALVRQREAAALLGAIAARKPDSEADRERARAARDRADEMAIALREGR